MKGTIKVSLKNSPESHTSKLFKGYNPLMRFIKVLQKIHPKVLEVLIKFFFHEKIKKLRNLKVVP